MTWRLTTIGSAAVLLLGTVVGVFIIAKILSMLKLCLFSPVKGIVVYKGQPVVGAVIERTCEWNWKKYVPQTDQTVTDEKGEFSLPGIYSLMGIVQLVPHEPVIHQGILIRYEEKTYGAWYSFKSEYEEFGELNGKLDGNPINLFCDLGVELKNHSFDGGGEYGGIAELRQGTAYGRK